MELKYSIFAPALSAFKFQSYLYGIEMLVGVPGYGWRADTHWQHG